jgi:hypothetical protein
MQARSANPKKTSPDIIAFLKASNVPPNFVLAIDTHSDVARGYLQHCASTKKEGSVAPVTEVRSPSLSLVLDKLTASKIVRLFLGTDLINLLQSGKVGFKALVLLSCGPAMTVPEHLTHLQNLVTR